ncbi:hypothetical protein J2S44_007739 [Catenuloplanes niger]|uniref:Uncharacterized protein n=1 Tax=Catenuloplanes niger TaxID=587534 RepID=A0AAE3ZYD0_9ACTN|nr:hypothetical protein [Catenuloplanes niger]
MAMRQKRLAAMAMPAAAVTALRTWTVVSGNSAG